MADRLTKITTRSGDQGLTCLGDGSRIKKTDSRVGLLGDVDELNSWIGVILAHAPGEEISTLLEGVQHDLFDLGGCLCFPETQLLSAAHVARLDQAVEIFNADLSPLKEFILPGGSPLLSWFHIARTCARRVERNMVELAGSKEDLSVAEYALAYLNRLSDVLFIAARFEAKRLSIQEVYWQKYQSVS